VRQRERLSAIRLATQGYHVQEIANMLSRTRQTISTYIQMFEQSGITGLLHRGASPGKPPRLSLEEQEHLKQTILSETPKSIGLGLEASWHTRNIQAYILAEFQIHLCREALRLMLHRLGLRYTRPTYQIKRANLSQQKEFQRELDIVKKPRGPINLSSLVSRRNPYP
jgi:transposase